MAVGHFGQEKIFLAAGEIFVAAHNLGAEGAVFWLCIGAKIT
jgi:hypothetical protein